MKKITIIVLILITLQNCSSQVLRTAQSSKYSYSIKNNVVYINFINYNYRKTSDEREGSIIIDDTIDCKDFANKLIDYGKNTRKYGSIIDHFGTWENYCYYDFCYEGNKSNYISIYNYFSKDIVFRISKTSAIKLGNKLLLELKNINNND